MNTVEIKKIWDEIKEQLEKEIPSSTFGPWISTLEAVSFEDDTFTLISGVAMGVEYVKRTQYKTILECFKNYFGRDIVVNLEFNQEAAEAIKKEIERLRKLLKEPDASCFQEAYLIGGEDTLNSISSFIESLEKEQPKIEDSQREWYNKGYIKGRKEAHIPARELGLPSSLDDNSPKIRGWVARCKWPCPDELYFYRGEEKPIRCGSQVEDVKEDFYWDFQHEVAPLDPKLFPDLHWDDEPIEVELTIHRV